jgi:hypothetical protein
VSAEPKTLTAWRTLLERPLAEQRGAIDAGAISADARYGALGGLTLVRDRAYFPGLLYFDGERPVLALVEFPAAVATDLDDAALLAYVGDDVEWLGSRAGKLSSLRVAAERGIAVSEQFGTKVDYLELFPPTTFDDYRERIHVEPPQFVK